ncbi:hypothetical protein GOV07_04185 [Candidatus Woesearchaeota archaeon]|nr:hypothetical protein [Candidatus Woesearchaeota archaeon]
MAFENVLPGGYAETSVLLSNSKDEPVTVTLEVEGEGVDWLVLNSSVILGPRGTERLTIALQPSIDAEGGSYEQRILLTSVPAGLSSVLGNRIALTVSVPLSFTITDARVPSCVLGGVRVADVELGDAIRIGYTISNTGNTRVTPRGNLRILDIAGKEVFRDDVQESETTLPTMKGDYENAGSSTLAEGEYEVVVSIEQCGEQSRRFWVLAPGTLGDEGAFTTLIPPASAEPLIAGFKNTGERSVRARFSGVVLQDGKIVHVIETEPLLVAPGQNVNLESYLDLPAGEYEIRGSVLYENKRTGERSLSVIVEPEVGNSSVVFSTLLLFLIIIGIILIVRIQKKR